MTGRYNPQDLSPDQGALIPVEFARDHPPVIGEPVEGGVFPGVEAEESQIAVDAVQKAEQTRNKRDAQAGKHSVLARDGSYLTIRPGDYLPGFGPVMDRNWENAKAYANRLERERTAKIGTQPALSLNESGEGPVSVQRVLAAAQAGGKKVIEATVKNEAPVTFEPNRRRAFGAIPGRVRDPHFDPEKLASLKPEDYARVEPDFLCKSYTVRSGEWVYNGVALTQEEYSIVLLNPKTFIDRAAAIASRGHTLSNPIRRAEVKISGPMHAFEASRDKHVGIVKGLNSQRDRLQELSHEAQAPGFAHKTEGELLILAHEAWQLCFKSLVQAAGRTHEFDPTEVEAMENALYDRLVNGGQRERVGYWQNMLKVGVDYTNARRLTMISSQNRVNSQIRTLQKKLDAFCEKHGIIR